MPTTLPVRRRPPRPDFGIAICLALACAPAALVAATGGSPTIDPENYAHLQAPVGTVATRFAASRICPTGEGLDVQRRSGSEPCRVARNRLAAGTTLRD